MSQTEYPFEGVLLIDKPSGLTSHDIVDRVRHKLRMKRVGHAGTLDPMATASSSSSSARPPRSPNT
jgi:tRNA U55 pseudouridine synthase TruB